jgi:hypothetical protein
MGGTTQCIGNRRARMGFDEERGGLVPGAKNRPAIRSVCDCLVCKQGTLFLELVVRHSG